MYQEKRQKLQMGRCRQQNYLDSQTWFNTTLEKDQGPDCVRICLMRLSASANLFCKYFFEVMGKTPNRRQNVLRRSS